MCNSLKKVNWFAYVAALIAAIAAITVNTNCILFFHQPKLPESLRN